MKPKKLMYIEDFYFVLPNDFKGTVSEALQLLTDYYKIREQKNNIDYSESGNHFDWICQNNDALHKHCGCLGMGELSEITDTYASILNN